MPTNYYDAVVLGQELAAVACGTLLSRRGFRVLWIGDGEAHESYRWDDLELQATPFIFSGAERPGIKRVLQETVLVQSIKRRLSSCRPAFQAVLPGKRIDVGENDVLAQELEREFAADRVAVQDALGRAVEIDRRLDSLFELDVTLPPQRFWERREVSKVGVDPRKEEDPASEFEDHHPFRAFLRAVSFVAADMAPEDLEPAIVARHYTTWRRGTSRLVGGRQALRMLLVEKLESNSGDTQAESRAEAVMLKRGKVEGVKLAGEREPVGCGAVIVGSPERAVALGDGHKAPRSLRSALESVNVAYGRYALNLVLPTEAVPEGMGTVVVSCDPNQPIAPDNTFLLEAGAPDDSGRVVLTASTLLDSRRTSGVDMRAKLRARVGEIVPFLDDNVLLVHSPHDGKPADGPLAEKGPEPMSWPMAPVYRSEKPEWGLGGYPYATGWKGLFSVSRGTLPALGFEGELTAAWGLARMLSTAEGKRDPLKRRSRFS